MKKGVIYTLAAVIIGVALLIFTFLQFPIDQFWSYIVSIEPALLLQYLAVSFVIFCLLAYRWQIILKDHGFNNPFHETLANRYIGFAASFLTPGPRVGGEPIRAALAAGSKERFPTALSTVIADKTIELISFGVMFIIGLAVTLVYIPLNQTARITLLSIFLILVALVGYAIFHMAKGRDPVTRIFKFLRLHKLKVVKKYEKELHEFESNIKNFYSRSKSAFLKASLVSMTAWTLSLLEFYLLLRMLGLNPGIPEVFLVYSAVGFAYLIPIPFALGVLDAAQVAVFRAINYPEAAGLATALITRGRDILWMVIGFILLTKHGIKHTKNILANTQEAIAQDTTEK